MTTTAAAAGTRRHTGTYPAEPRQVGLARAALTRWLGGGPQAAEAILGSPGRPMPRAVGRRARAQPNGSAENGR